MKLARPATALSVYSKTGQFDSSGSKRAPSPVGSVPKNLGTPAGPLRAGAGTVLAFGIILSLGVKTDDASDLISQITENNIWDSVAKSTMNNVAGAALPTSSTDLIAAAVGESLGGIMGAICGGLIAMANVKARSNMKPLVTNAIADGDFFIANSASLPLLTATGLSPGLASLVSVILASFPSQLVKQGARQKEIRLQEEKLLQELLEEELAFQEQRKSLLNPFAFQANNKRRSISRTVNPDELVPAVAETQIDFVEAFSDVTRWLAYDVLKTDFGGSLIWDGIVLDTALAGAFFGLFAAISSQLYADVLYGRFQYGPKSRQEEVRSRKAVDWFAVYSAKAFSTATLFGVYEYSQGPISRWIQGTLAGGVDGCLGSTSFDVCLQTYIDTNAPGPSPEAQFRALVTNLYMVGQRLQDIAGDTTLDDVKALIGAWAVAFNSYLQNFLL